MGGCQAGVVEPVEQAQLVVEQEGAVEAAVGVLDLAEAGELLGALALGRLEQRPAGGLDPPAGGGVRALVGVPLLAADLIGRPGSQAQTWKGSKQISASCSK